MFLKKAETDEFGLLFELALITGMRPEELPGLTMGRFGKHKHKHQKGTGMPQAKERVVFPRTKNKEKSPFDSAAEIPHKQTQSAQSQAARISVKTRREVSEPQPHLCQ